MKKSARSRALFWDLTGFALFYLYSCLHFLNLYSCLHFFYLYSRLHFFNLYSRLHFFYLYSCLHFEVKLFDMKLKTVFLPLGQDSHIRFEFNMLTSLPHDILVSILFLVTRRDPTCSWMGLDRKSFSIYQKFEDQLDRIRCEAVRLTQQEQVWCGARPGPWLMTLLPGMLKSPETLIVTLTRNKRVDVLAWLIKHKYVEKSSFCLEVGTTILLQGEEKDVKSIIKKYNTNPFFKGRLFELSKYWLTLLNPLNVSVDLFKLILESDALRSCLWRTATMALTNLNGPTCLSEKCVQMLEQRGVECSTVACWIQDANRVSRNNSVWSVRTLMMHVTVCDTCCLALAEQPWLASLSCSILLSGGEQELATTLVSQLVRLMLDDSVPLFIHLLEEQKCKLSNFAEAIALSLGAPVSNTQKQFIPQRQQILSNSNTFTTNTTVPVEPKTESLEDWQKRNGIVAKKQVVIKDDELDEFDEFAFDDEDFAFDNEDDDGDEGEEDDEV